MKIIQHTISLFIIIAICFSPTITAAERSDSLVIERQNNFQATQLIVPGTLIALGASSFFLAPMRDLDHSLQHNMLDLRGNHHRIALDEYLRFVPTALNISLYIIEKDHKYDIYDKALVKATSIASMYILTQGMKHAIKRTRPDGSDNHSFPSGHVATAFLGAESLRISHGNWWGVAGYSVATTTAFLRMYNNRHWFSDVVTAAGIGVLSARIGYWLLPWERRILGLDNKKSDNTSFLAVPTFDAHNNAYGLSLALQF